MKDDDIKLNIKKKIEEMLKDVKLKDQWVDWYKDNKKQEEETTSK